MLNYNGTPKSGWDLVSAGVCDPIYTFIKDEPHKLEKLKAGKYRIISGVSLVDNLVERLLYSTLNKVEIELHNYISFKPGMGLHDEGQRDLYNAFQRCQSEDDIVSTDVSGWDWSVCMKLLLMDHRYRCLFVRSRAWKKLSYVRNLCLQYKVFQLPSGEMYEQLVPGIQCSGSYNTSSTNSHMRFFLSFIVARSLGVTPKTRGVQMGDDALEGYVEGMKQRYVDFGFTVKEVTRMATNVFEFCSTLWDNSEKGFPLSWTKTLFRFLFKNTDDPMYPMYREQFLRDLRNYPDITSLIQRVDVFRGC